MTLVHTDTGPVLGYTRGAFTTFRAIPYAEPPVGSLRFRPPVPIRAWAGVRDASDGVVEPECVQTPDANSYGLPGWAERLEEAIAGVSRRTMNEDCLTLTVSTPDVHSSLPVMLYIHGGSFLSGNSNLSGAAHVVCSRGIVVVSINYRLGVLGNLALPELLAESGTTGNYGLQDQREAMRWVRRNAHAFGGDASRVTLSGESAGAMSVIAHLALPRSTSLFAQAIAASTVQPRNSEGHPFTPAAVGRPSPCRATTTRRRSATPSLRASGTLF